jgi:hypothetical protein
MNEGKQSEAAKTPLIERVAELSMSLSQKHLEAYGATRSRHDFTQRQLMSCLILRAYLQTTYRGVLDILASSQSLRQRLGLTDKLPHFTTLQKFSARSQVVQIAQKIVAAIGQEVAANHAEKVEVAMDATGLERTTASDYFCSRRGRRFRRWVKVSVVVICGFLVPTALVVDLNPTHDCKHAEELLPQAQAIQPTKLYADPGYDAEWIHVQCREESGVESVIPAVTRRRDGTIGGKWRARMTQQYLKKAQYGRRWSAESFFSAMKRTMGSALKARRPDQMLAEAAIRVLAYAIRR